MTDTFPVNVFGVSCSLNPGFPMASILAPLLPTLAHATLILVGFLLLWQPMNHLQDCAKNGFGRMDKGFERMERQLDKQQDLILALTDPARRSTMSR